MLENPKHFPTIVKPTLLLNNFFLKLTALMLAIVVWLVFHRSDQSILAGKEDSGFKNNVRKSIERIPLKIIQPSGDVRRFSLSESTVQAEFSGDPSSIKKLTTNEVLAFVNAEFHGSNLTSLPVWIHVPPGIRVDKTVPIQVQLRLLTP